MKIRLAGLRKLAEDLAEVFRLREKGEAELYYKVSILPRTTGYAFIRYSHIKH